MPNIRRLAHSVLFVFAMAWPWQVFQYIPGLGAHLTGLLAILLCALLFLDILINRRFRVPFEVLLPVFALGLVIGYAALAHKPAMNDRLAATLFFFLAVTHFADSRAAVARWAGASAFNMAAVALFDLAAPALRLIPTAFDPSSGATLTFAFDFSNGLYTLLLVCVGSVCVLAGRDLSWKRWGVALGLLLACGLPVVIAATRLLPLYRHWVLPDISEQPGATFLAHFLVLYLAARVAAKIEVERREGASGWHAPVLVLIGVTLVWRLIAPLEPRLYLGFLLGLACGYALPEETRPPSFRFAPVGAAALIAALAAVNAARVFPANQDDPRNYDAAAARHFARGDLDAAAKSVAKVELYAPDERRTHLWLARIALAMEQPLPAALEFEAAIAPAEGLRLILPSPTETEKQDFLVRLRDLCSSLHDLNRHFAYERTLARLGQWDAAEFSLRARVQPGAEGLVQDPDPIAAAVAYLMGDSTEQDRFQDWSVGELSSLLADWGGVVKDVDGQILAPLITIAYRTPWGLNVAVFSPQTRWEGGEPPQYRYPPSIPGREKGLFTLAWDQEPLVSGETDGRFVLLAERGGHRYPIIFIRPKDDGVEAQWAALRPLEVPYEPAITIWR